MVAKDFNTKMQRTALHWASIKGNNECYALLIANGADASLVDAFNKTPLQYVEK